MDKQYSVQFFTRFVEAMQKFCRDYIEFEQAVELSGYLSVEIDNYKKERYVLSEMVHNTGDVISESYCVKAFKTMKRLPPKSSDSDIVLRDNTNTRRSGGYTDSQSSHQNIPSYRSRIHPAGISHAGHPSNFSQQSPSQKYGQSPMRRNQPPSFAQGSPVHRESQESLASKNRSQQIQPRQSIQVPESRGQKRPSTDGTGDGQNKKEKTDTDLESLYNAATNIVCSTDSTATTQSDTASTTLSQPVSTSSESIRLPLTDILTIKEENDVILLDDEGGGPNQMGDSQLDVSSFGNDSNSGSNLLDNSSLGSGDMFGASMSGPGDGNPSTSSMSNDPMSSMQEVPVNEEGEFPYIYMYSRHPRKSMRERLVKAVCKFPGSVINPRLLQKRLFGAQISQVKIELDYLESCGFGKLTLFEKQIGIKPKWRFVKLHPDELNLENAQHYEVLSLAGFTVTEYRTVFEDPDGCHG